MSSPSQQFNIVDSLWSARSLRDVINPTSDELEGLSLSGANRPFSGRDSIDDTPVIDIEHLTAAGYAEIFLARQAVSPPQTVIGWDIDGTMTYMEGFLSQEWKTEKKDPDIKEACATLFDENTIKLLQEQNTLFAHRLSTPNLLPHLLRAPEAIATFIKDTHSLGAKHVIVSKAPVQHSTTVLTALLGDEGPSLIDSVSQQKNRDINRAYALLTRIALACYPELKACLTFYSNDNIAFLREVGLQLIEQGRVIVHVFDDSPNNIKAIREVIGVGAAHPVRANRVDDNFIPQLSTVKAAVKALADLQSTQTENSSSDGEVISTQSSSSAGTLTTPPHSPVFFKGRDQLRHGVTGDLPFSAFGNFDDVTPATQTSAGQAPKPISKSSGSNSPFS